jgi:hypothetical protein
LAEASQVRPLALRQEDYLKKKKKKEEEKNTRKKILKTILKKKSQLPPFSLFSLPFPS